jgi:hypothetical protein
MYTMARKQHTHHYIYKTTCNVTGRYYIGMHSTSNLEDGYIGSGRRLWLSINKHGKENHSVEILEWLPDRSSLKLREKELVNEDLLKDEMCMNLQIGGGGGLGGEEHAKKFHTVGRIATNKILLHKLKNDEEYRKKFCEAVSKSVKGKQPWLNKKHSPETKQKIGKANSISQSGEKNSQYGTCWINDGKNAIKIKHDKLIEYINNGWNRGRKLNSNSN